MLARWKPLFVKTTLRDFREIWPQCQWDDDELAERLLVIVIGPILLAVPRTLQGWL